MGRFKSGEHFFVAFIGAGYNTGGYETIKLRFTIFVRVRKSGGRVGVMWSFERSQEGCGTKIEQVQLRGGGRGVTRFWLFCDNVINNWMSPLSTEYFLGDDLLYEFLFHWLRLKTLQREV